MCIVIFYYYYYYFFVSNVTFFLESSERGVVHSLSFFFIFLFSLRMFLLKPFVVLSSVLQLPVCPCDRVCLCVASLAKHKSIVFFAFSKYYSGWLWQTGRGYERTENHSHSRNIRICKSSPEVVRSEG